jgi:CRISPR-associated protein Cmr2
VGILNNATLNEPNARYLLAVSIGPVQPFIAAARRMRDLWYGSTMLSSLARAAAKELHAKAGTVLIFPTATALATGASPDQGANTGVSNKLLAVLPPGANPAQVAEAVKRAVQAELTDVIGRACLRALSDERCELPADGDQHFESRFKKQLEQFLEVFCAWVPLHELEGPSTAYSNSYALAYSKVQSLLEARKRLRDFAPNATAAVGARLSSLDGAAETVLPKDDLNHKRRRIFGIDSTEELDALGLIKRVLGREMPFAAVARVALQPYIERWTDDECAAVEGALAAFNGSGLASKNKCTAPDPMARLPWDCELLLKSRRDVLRGEMGRAELWVSPGDLAVRDQLITNLAALEAALGALKPKAPGKAAPLPGDEALYVAVLQADGDRMGALLSDASTDRQAHQRISEALGRLAAQAAGIVAKHGGSCIYSGGDDTLAMLPVSRALACAQELAHASANGLKDEASLAAGRAQPTLSVGVAMVHVLMPFGPARQLASQALKLAKEGADRKGLRNALGLLVQPRSGAPVQWSGRWDDPATPATPAASKRLESWRDAFAAKALGHSLPYDLLALGGALPERALRAAAQRLFERRLNPKALDPCCKCLRGQWEAQVDALAMDSTPANACEMLAHEMYVARWLAARLTDALDTASPEEPCRHFSHQRAAGTEPGTSDDAKGSKP